MSKAAELAALIGSQSSLSNRNLIINGAMQVWQRGTSFSTGTSQAYTCDRWSTASGSSFNYDATITRETDVPTGSGFNYCTKIAVDTVQTPTSLQNGGFHQKLEQQDVLRLAYGSSSAKRLTLSFWVKSNKTGTYTIQLQQNSGSGGTGNYFLKEYTINSSATWEYKTLTFDGNTSQAFDVTSDADDALRVIWWHTVGSSDYGTLNAWTASNSYVASSNQVNLFETAGNYWQITGVQLEVGEQATPFEHRSFGDELARCQRYYHQLQNNFWFHPVDTSTQYRRVNLEYPTTMRSLPTITITLSASGSGSGIQYQSVSGITYYIDGISGAVRTDDTTKFDAEL